MILSLSIDIILIFPSEKVVVKYLAKADQSVGKLPQTGKSVFSFYH